MKNINFKKIGIYLIPVFIFIALSFIYFSPVLNGKSLQQYDIANAKGMAKEIQDFRAKTGEEPLWTNSMFGGMPAYLISIIYEYDIIKYFRQFIEMFKPPVNFMYLAFLCAYLALLLMGTNIWLATIGAFAYGLSSYFIIIIEVGHTSKMLALGYMPMVVAGVWYTFNKRILLGAALTGLFLALQIASSHPQITYYTFIILGILFLSYLPYYYKNKLIAHFLKATGVLAIAGLLAFGTSTSRLWTIYEYGKYSMRGKSELKSNVEVKTSGLDKDYATAWSYGKLETFNLLIPNLMGGSSHGNLGQNSEFFEVLKKNGVPNARQIVNSIPAYWGPQSSTSGPVYIGAAIIFLFFLAIFLVKGPIKWWLIVSVVLSFILAWGRNLTVGELLSGGSFFIGAVLLFYFLENRKFLTPNKQKIIIGTGAAFLILFFVVILIPSNKVFDTIFNYLVLDYLPGYNKFRTVSMTLVIAELAIPFLGILGLKSIIEDKITKQEFMRAFRWATGITAGICLIFIVIPGSILSFNAEYDQQLLASGWPDFVIDAMKQDRKSLVVNDAFRSLIFIILMAGAVLLLFYNKIKKEYVLASIALLIVLDLWIIDRRYLNEDNFVNKKRVEEPFMPTSADLFIMKDTDPNFRVYNLTVNAFADVSTSYFHKSIGGYHGAKMKRYQELIEHHISQGNMAVLNMLNTKYFIVNDANKKPVPQINWQALGNAWFVDSIKWVENADSEITALSNFNPEKVVIVDKRFHPLLTNFSFKEDSGALIKLISYKPNHLVYESHTLSDQIAVFSEIYYDKGWNAYIDGKPAQYFRANYVLRSMILPSGKHTIDFKFEPKSYYLGNKISLASSLLLILFIFFSGYSEIKKNKKD